jgi:glucose-1-phosphate thymidylyltransferase
MMFCCPNSLAEADMNVIILAGGRAERLWPLTEQMPKTLLEVGGKPVLYHLLQNAGRIPVATSITIAIDENKKTFFDAAIKKINIPSRLRPMFSVHYLDGAGNIKGPLAKVAEILEMEEKYHIQGDDFLILGGDNVFGFDLELFCRYYGEKGKDCIAIHKTQQPADGAQFGQPTLDRSGRVVSLVEKNKVTITLISTAAYCFKRQSIQTVNKYLESREPDVLGSFIQWLARKFEIIGFQFEEKWFDIGSRQGLIGASAMFMNDAESATLNWSVGSTYVNLPVYIERRGTTIVNSTIGPFAYIGANTTVVNSTIENSIVYDDCRIQNCSLKNSVVGTNSVIEGDLGEAVVGPKTKIRKVLND